ncbi:MAG: hypothetical protein ABI912_04880 [Actinomycetota bacterium]
MTEMTHNQEPDERDFDSVLRGRRPTQRPDLEPLAQLVDDLRLATSLPARPSTALAALLAAGLPATAAVTVAPAPRRRRTAAAVRWATSLRTAAKAGVLAGIAVLGVASAATAGVLPAAVQQKVSTGVETVTPWHIPHPAGHGIGELVREKARHHGQDKDKNKDDSSTPPAVVPPGQSGKPDNPGNSDHSKKANSGHDESETPESEAPESEAPESESAKPSHSDHSGNASKPSESPEPSHDPGRPSAAGRPTDPGSNGKGHDKSHAPDAVPTTHPEPQSGK